MGKKVVSEIMFMLILLLIGMLALAFNIQPVKSDYTWSETIYIRADGSIEPADAPISTVDNVAYMLTDNIVGDVPSRKIAIVIERDNIVLDGAGYTLQGTGSGTGINLTGRINVTIKSMTIKQFDYDVYLFFSSNNLINGNNITNNYNDIGVYLEYSSNNTIYGNKIANNSCGIYLGWSLNNSISLNNITNNFNGVYLCSSSNNNTINGNNITANKDYGVGISASDYNSIVGNVFVNDGLAVEGSYGSVVVDNTVNGKPLVYLEDVSDYTVEEAGQVILVNCNRITAENFNLSNTIVGVELWQTNNTTIAGSYIANNEVGIYLYNSSNNSVAGNTVTANNYGVFLYGSSNNSISKNAITDNKECGINLCVFSNNNTISGNNITNSTQGITLWEGSCYNSISGNSITMNVRGIYLASSWHNSISGNNITNNKWGIYLTSSNSSISLNNIINNRWGVYLYSSSSNTINENNITNNNDAGVYLYSSSDNKFWHNNFINNIIHQVDIYSSWHNIWDDGYPSGGNYWSDYTGVDLYSGAYQNITGSDGIGDTPYYIYGRDVDRYPLMRPWPPQEHDLTVSLTAPFYLPPGNSILLNATLTNVGLNDEVNVEFILLIDGATINSTIIPHLQPWESYTLTYLWTPTNEGRYNITAYAPPVPNETSIKNNQETKFVILPEVDVKAGGWIKHWYTITDWPTGQPYPEWLKMEFLTVEETNVTARVTMHMSDGTEQNATVPVDVVAGGQALGLSGLVIPANLTVGDPVYMTGYGWLTLEGETTRTYAGANRTALYASFSQYGTQLTYYWDKQTGVMVEASTISTYMNATAKATETNMWTPEKIIFNVPWDGETYPVTVISNSIITNFNFSQPLKQIGFNVTGPEGSTGYCNITIPTTLLGGPYKVTINTHEILEWINPPTNGTHTFLYFTYNHSTQTIVIQGTTVIPEFPSNIALLVFLMLITIPLIFAKSKHFKKGGHLDQTPPFLCLLLHE